MADRSITVKWNKNTYDVTLTADESIDSFRAKLTALTQVPAERQKLMLKGKFVKDTAAVAAVAAGAQIVLMGTADDALLAAPAAAVVFAEDLSAEQKVRLNVAKDPAGLVNLGNTCYMNAVVQLLRAVPELHDASLTHMRLANAAGTAGAAAAAPGASVAAAALAGALAGGPHERLALAFGLLMDLADKTDGSVTPLIFLSALRKAFPQFAEMSRSGQVGAQQDADECLTQLFTALADKMRHVPSDKSVSRGMSNWIDMLFGAEMRSSLSSPDAPAEAPVVEFETVRRLKCFISGEVNFMVEGIKLALKEEITKRSSSLGRDIVYTRTSGLTSLPPYLTVQFERFFWKSDNGKNIKSKIIRKVAFPVRFDVFDITEGDLKASLKARRAIMIAEQDVKLGLPALKSPHSNAAAANGASSSLTSAGAAMTDDTAASAVAPHPLTSGQYELQSVVTHKGRDADSGHYIGWTKQADGRWFKFDDDVVTEVKEADITALCGGGDWHTAYLVVYRRVDDVKEAEEAKAKELKDKEAAAATAGQEGKVEIVE